jgi:hypothetical protein
LITELRKELRLSNEEHRELLARVNADDVIRRIRYDWMMKQSFFTLQMKPLLFDQSRYWFFFFFFFVFNVYDFGQCH